MTAPRSDMGDSIKKAFSNVDDILQDLQLDTSETNRRAVRILAYNNTDVCFPRTMIILIYNCLISTAIET